MFSKIINVSLMKTAFAKYHAALLQLFGQRKRASIVLPAGRLTYTYEDPWITIDTDCYGHDMATKAEIDTSVTWVFYNGSVVFTMGRALSQSVEIKFGMVKSEVSNG